MTVLPLDLSANDTPAALRAFLGECQKAAAKDRRAKLVSISLEVDALDPLAVLESIFEPGERHFYIERPAESLALAGAEAVLTFTADGKDRFAACQRFVSETLANTLAVGDLTAPFAGPHFFTAFAFQDQTEPGEPFQAVNLFVPRWQVACSAGRTVAVANLLVDIGTPLDLLAERVWRARRKFGAFDYSAPEFSDTEAGVNPIEVTEVGGTGHYEAAVARALRRIEAGEFQKIVLARAKDLRAAVRFHPLRVLNGLRQRYPDCYSFSVANGCGQSLIGASPERLLRVRQGRLLTEALAGSTRRGASAREDASLAGELLHSRKDLAEHDLVLQSILRRLSPLGLQPACDPRPGIKRLANVQHLHTRIEAEMPSSVQVLDVLSRVHPTPAVGGSPREAAVQAIRELEGFPRGLYAGAIGWLDAKGEGEFFVGLRTALVDGNTARLYAGAGIVAGSEPRAERDETELKFSALEAALLGKQA